MSSTYSSIEELRERILSSASFDLRTLGHPVSRVTIDAAATAAGVSASTVGNQAGSTEEFRHRLHHRLIDRAQTRPGPATWDAVHQSLHDGDSPLVALSRVCVARISELSIDPAFPFVLGAFDNLEVPGLTDRLRRYCDDLGQELTPLLLAAIAPHHQPSRRSAGESNTTLTQAVALVLMSGTLRTLLAEPGYPWTIMINDHEAVDLLVIALGRQCGLEIPRGTPTP